jgi:hypothetical protein
MQVGDEFTFKARDLYCPLGTVNSVKEKFCQKIWEAFIFKDGLLNTISSSAPTVFQDFQVSSSSAKLFTHLLVSELCWADQPAFTKI